RLRTAGATTALGVDVVTTVGGDMFSVMRAALLSTYLVPGPHVTPGDILRMATLDGAVALGLADQVGSLKVGKQADIVMLRADGVSVACAPDHTGPAAAAAPPGNAAPGVVAGGVVRQNGKVGAHALTAVRARALQAGEYVTATSVSA